MNFHELDNFNLSDTVKYHNRLNPRLWGSDEHLLPDVRAKLLAIAEDFSEFLGVDDLRVQDITLSGSNAAYNYTDRSDIDLHLVVDMPDDAVYQELFNAKKYQYNHEHNLTIGGADVELYVQPADQPHVSQGIYSVKDGKWLQVPRRKRTHIDDSCVRNKAADLDARIHAAVESNDAAAIDALWNKIKTMRETGLEQHGEFGCENIVFKVLRDQGCIRLLKDAKLAARDHELSLAEQRRVKPRVTYGFKDPVTEDVTITPDGVSASTRMFLSEKGDQDDIIVHDFIQHVVRELGIDPAPEIKLHTDPEWSESNHSFGRYDPDSRTLNVSLPNRHILDVLRTVAHELVHCDQHQTHGELPADAGETGSAYENDANARAGIIMRDFAAAHPEYFEMEPLGEGASGYIPKNRREAAMPQYAMALSVDVKPGQTGKEANKMGLQTGPNGEPTLLMKNLRNALKEFKKTGRLTEQQDLFEINMGGKNLRREAAKTGALAGMEFEMIVPNTQNEDEYDQEPDYDMDERASSPRDIRDFFYDGDFNSRRSVDGLIDSMMDDFSEWQSEAFDTRWESDSEQMIYDYIKDNMDDDDVRGLLDLESEDPVGRNEYQLAAEKITAEQIQPWYEDAQESAREEFYENDDGFEEWLSDAELAYMSDIERRYSGDITWPHYRSVSSGEGASVQETAESFSQAVGRPARASESYHEYGQERPAPGKNFYVVEPDGSLEPDDPDDAGLEFVSPPLPIDEIMSDLNKVKRWADQNGCYTNKSTGLHINISVPNYDLDRLDFVKLALLMGDEYVLDLFGRASNTYARSAMGKVRDHVQKRPYEAKYLLDKMKGHMGELASKAIHSGITDKYTSINTKDGHVEFRSPGGDWLGDNFGQIENTLLRFTVALSAAMDPKAYREEYLKKLYKILAPKDEKDPLAVFAKYAAGELPATALKSFVRQAQADRKAKKSGEAIVNAHRWRVSLKPELGGGVVEVMATDPIDAKKQAIIQQPNWRFVDDSALTIERLDEPAAGASTTGPHPQGRGRPNDPNGRLAIVRRDDPRVFAYSSGTPSPAPDYLFRFTLADGYSQAQLRSVLAAWAARENANAADYMIVDTTQFLAPEQTAAPEAGSVQWNIINRDNETVHTFWNRNVQADANAAAHEWLTDHRFSYSVDGQGPFDVVPAAIPGSTLDLQRQRQAADAAANTRRWADYEASQAATPTPVPGVQDIEIEIPPAQTQWEVYDRNTGQPVFRMYAENQAEAWRKGQEWVANNDWEINAANYSVRQSAEPVTEGKVKLHTDPGYFGAEIDNSGFDSLPVIDIPTHKLVGFEPDDKMNQPKSQANVKKIVAGLKKGDKLPPILVRKHNRGYQVLDGHHRFYAYKLLGIKSIPARIVPDKDIEEIGKQDVTEGRKSKIIVKPSPGKGNGLFATKLIKAGEVITSSKFEHISDKDWQLIKNTTPVKLYGFKLGDKHALQSGPFKFKFTDQKEKALWDKTEFKGLSLSGFMFVNGADSPDEVNSKERFSNNTAEMIATQDIQPGQEIIKQYNVPTTGVTEGRENDRISFRIQKGKNRFATAMKVNDQQVGVYQYNANTGRSVAEIYPEFKGKGLGKLLVLHAIYTAAQLGLDFQEDESRTSAYDNVLDSLSSNGYIVDDDGRWYVTNKGEQYLTQSIKQDVTESSIQYNELNQDNKNLIIDRARDKANGIYSFRGIMFRVRNGKVTHWAVDGKILQAMGHFNTQVGSYEPGRSSQAKVMLKSIKEGVAEGAETYLSPNMKAVPNTDPTSPEDHDYYYKDQQIKPGDPFHSKIKDLHLRQLDPTYDAFRNAFDNPIKPGPAVPEQPPQGDTIIPSRPVPPAKIKGPDGKPLKLKDIIQLDPPLSEGNGPGKPVVDAILKVIPVAQEIWFHGSRATGRHRKNSDTDILVIVPDDLVGDQYLGVVRILQKLSAHFDNYDIQPARAGSNIHRVAQEEGRLLWSNQQDVAENFADGRHPEDKGDSKRHHVPTKSSVSNLRKFAKSHSGRAAQLAHWMANMKAGRAKKKTNETVIGNLHFPQLTIAVDDHAIDRTRTRGIDPATIDLSLKKLNAVADQLSQIEPNAQVWAYDAENNLGLGMRRISSRDMLFKLKTVVAARPFDGAIPIIELS